MVRLLLDHGPVVFCRGNFRRIDLRATRMSELSPEGNLLPATVVHPPLAASGPRDEAASAVPLAQSKLGRVLHFRLVTDRAECNLLIHLAAERLITEFNVVEP
jgi:hypothetical protein